MKLSQYEYDFSMDLIAKNPPVNRDEARLLVLDRKTGKIEHKMFKDALSYFSPEDTFVFNDTKVFPARLSGNKEKTGAIIDIFLLRELNAELFLWDVLVTPARKIRIGNKLYFGEDDSLVAEVIDNTTSRGRTLRFLYDGDHAEFKKILHDLGKTPLPDWIRSEVTEEDAESYQTIYAKNEGAVVAPSAGLHFSKHMLKRMEIKGVKQAFLTLHAGMGNYCKIDVEDLTKFKLHSEKMHITQETSDLINDTKNKQKKICAVGTTVMRAMETTVTTTGRVTQFDGWTNKYIMPPYEFTVADAMITNLHLPKSIQLIMVSAFAGYDNTMKAYKEAIKEGYKFDAYGDAMLII